MNNERIVIAGFGGQGVMLMGQLLAYAATNKELNTLWFPSYGPETRGGTANCQVIIADGDIYSPVFSECETAIIMNGPSLDKFESKVAPGGKIFINSSLVERKVERTDITVYEVPVNEIALELGVSQVANMVMLGAYLEVVKTFEDADIIKVLTKMFGEGKAHLIAVNEDALKEGRKQIK
ncbi:2-oxoacid:acceptor oxidoreductase family protein [Mycoplasmatota bacterium WC44]